MTTDGTYRHKCQGRLMLKCASLTLFHFHPVCQSSVLRWPDGGIQTTTTTTTKSKKQRRRITKEKDKEDSKDKKNRNNKDFSDQCLFVLPRSAKVVLSLHPLYACLALLSSFSFRCASLPPWFLSCHEPQSVSLPLLG